MLKDYLDYAVNIKKEKDDFIILNITDMQYEISDIFLSHKIEQFRETLKELVEKTKPNLITVTGDLSYENHTPVLKATCDIIDSFCIPWAPILGNHDPTANVIENHFSTEQAVDFMASYKYCLIKHGPKNLNMFDHYGRYCDGNYVVNITENIDGKGYVVRSLVFINSGSYHKYTEEELNGKEVVNNAPDPKLSDEMVNFIIECANKANTLGYNGQEVKTTVFAHIPIFGIYKAINEALNCPYNLFKDEEGFLSFSKEIPLNDSENEKYWRDDYKNSFGVMRDKMSCCRYDDNVLERLEKVPNIDSYFVGHCHRNTFIIDYKGIRMGFMLKTGDRSDIDVDINGGTKITIKNNEKPIVEHLFTKLKDVKSDFPAKYYDQHCHSKYSVDSKESIENYIARANEIGVDYLVFTNHVDFDYKKKGENWLVDFKKEDKELKELAEKNKNIHFLRGVELGYSKKRRKDFRKIIDENNFDVVNLSMHLPCGIDVYEEKNFEKYGIDKTLKKYFKCYYKMVKEWDDFDVCCHIDYAFKTAHKIDKTIKITDYEKELKKIFKLIIKKDKVLEINTKVQEGIGDDDHLRNLIKMYMSVGGSLFTVSSDAHKSDRLCSSFNHTFDILKEFGINYLAFFVHRQIYIYHT